MVSIPGALALQFCDALADSCDAGGAAGSLRFYSGTPPANVDAALSGNTLLAQLPLSFPAFGAAGDLNPNARATANAITSDASADATGTCSFARILDSAGTARLQLSVTATGGGGDIELNSLAFTIGETVAVTSLTITVRE